MNFHIIYPDVLLFSDMELNSTSHMYLRSC